MELPSEKKLEGTDYTVEIHKIYRNALVIDNQLVDQEVKPDSSDAGANPAVQLTLRGAPARQGRDPHPGSGEEALNLKYWEAFLSLGSLK